MEQNQKVLFSTGVRRGRVKSFSPTSKQRLLEEELALKIKDRFSDNSESILPFAALWWEL